MPHLPKIPQKLDAFLREETGRVSTHSIILLSAAVAAIALATARLAHAQTNDSNAQTVGADLANKPQPAHFHSHLSSPPGTTAQAIPGLLSNNGFNPPATDTNSGTGG